MPERWIDEHAGSEVQPRAGFEGELDETLRAAWRGELVSVSSRPMATAWSRRRWTALVGSAAAVVVLVAGIAVLVARDDDTAGPTAPADSTPDADATSTSIAMAPSLPPTSTPTDPGTTVTGTTVTGTAPASSTSSGPTLPSTTVPLSVVPSSTQPAPSTLPPTTAPPAPSSTTIPPHSTIPVIAATPEQQTVLDYLAALDDGRWEEAARLLGEGGLEWEARSDLRPLFGDDGTLPSLPDALRTYCESGAMCMRPMSITTSANHQVAQFHLGDREVSGGVEHITRSSMFSAGTFEGSPSVRGLPLRLPPAGVDVDSTVECVTEFDGRTDVADLDGDGWGELLSVVEDASGYDVLVCGTVLDVDPYHLAATGGSLRLDVLDADGDGSDELLMSRSTEDGRMTGQLFRLGGRALVATAVQFTQTAPVDGQPGTSFGCVDDEGTGAREFLRFEYTYVGGTDLGNSTALSWSSTHLLRNTDETAQTGTYALPAEEQAAFRLIDGWCDGLPIRTE